MPISKIILLDFICSNLQANVVYDYETNIFFKEIIKSITEVNNFKKNVSFAVILDDEPNAFITENNNLIISSGLIKFSDSYEAIVGVIASDDKFKVEARLNRAPLSEADMLSWLEAVIGYPMVYSPLPAFP